MKLKPLYLLIAAAVVAVIYFYLKSRKAKVDPKATGAPTYVGNGTGTAQQSTEQGSGNSKIIIQKMKLSKKRPNDIARPE